MKLAFVSHHKCGTDWFVSYLKKIDELNGLTFSSTHLSYGMPKDADIIFLTNAVFGYTATKIERACHIIRNPLSIVTSAYFSHKHSHPLANWPELALQRKILESVDDHDGHLLTLAFLERVNFYPGAAGPLHGILNWKYADARYPTFTMEALTQEPSHIVRKMLSPDYQHLTLPSDDDFRFEVFWHGRAPGAIDNTSHYRSGKSDAWRQHLPPAAVAYVKAHYGELLKDYYPQAEWEA